MASDSAGRFSRRHGYSSDSNEISYREDAPESLRVGLLHLLTEKLGQSPSELRETVCGVLRCRPDPNNWSEYPNIWDEVQQLVYGCEWYQIYDLIETVDSRLARARFPRRRQDFVESVNVLLVEEGAGWQLIDGLIEVRGDDAFEAVVEEAVEELDESGFMVATTELAEARRDMSRRPEADLSGAVQHAMAALEAVARETTGDHRATLGEIIRRNPDLFPRPVDEAASKLWGFASENARHGRESRNLEWAEAQLMVGVSAVLVSYLLNKSEDFEPAE